MDEVFSTNYFFRPSATPATPVTEGSHFSDFDFKVIDYMGQLERQDMVKSQVTQTRYNRWVRGDRFSAWLVSSKQIIRV